MSAAVIFGDTGAIHIRQQTAMQDLDVFKRILLLPKKRKGSKLVRVQKSDRRERNVISCGNRLWKPNYTECGEFRIVQSKAPKVSREW